MREIQVCVLSIHGPELGVSEDFLNNLMKKKSAGDKKACKISLHAKLKMICFYILTIFFVNQRPGTHFKNGWKKKVKSFRKFIVH